MQKDLKKLELYVKMKVVEDSKKNSPAVTVICEEEIKKYGFSYGDLILVATRLEEACFLERIDTDSDFEAKCVQVIYRKK